MNDQNFLTFTIEFELNSVLNASDVLRTGIIFCHGDHWRYQLREKSSIEHERLEETGNLLIDSDADLDIAKRPFDFRPVKIEIQWLTEGPRSLCVITSINDRPCEAEFPQGTRSPIVPMNFPGRAEPDAARILDDATDCCWLNAMNIK